MGTRAQQGVVFTCACEVQCVIVWRQRGCGHHTPRHQTSAGTTTGSSWAPLRVAVVGWVGGVRGGSYIHQRAQFPHLVPHACEPLRLCLHGGGGGIGIGAGAGAGAGGGAWRLRPALALWRAATGTLSPALAATGTHTATAISSAIGSAYLEQRAFNPAL